MEKSTEKRPEVATLNLKQVPGLEEKSNPPASSVCHGFVSLYKLQVS